MPVADLLLVLFFKELKFLVCNGVVVVATLISVRFSLRDISSLQVHGEAVWGKLPLQMLL